LLRHKVLNLTVEVFFKSLEHLYLLIFCALSKPITACQGFNLELRFCASGFLRLLKADFIEIQGVRVARRLHVLRVSGYIDPTGFGSLSMPALITN